MPIQPAEIHRGEVLRAEVSTHAPQEEPCDHDHANDDVSSVQAGHGVVNAEIQVGVGGTLGVNPRIGVVGVIIMPTMIRMTCMISMISMRMVIVLIVVGVIAVITMMVGLAFGLLCVKHGQAPR